MAENRSLKSPKDAEISVIIAAGDDALTGNCRMMAVTVHHLGQHSALNLWFHPGTKWERAVEERVMAGPPSLAKLAGLLVWIASNSATIEEYPYLRDPDRLAQYLTALEIGVLHLKQNQLSSVDLTDGN